MPEFWKLQLPESQHLCEVCEQYTNFCDLFDIEMHWHQEKRIQRARVCRVCFSDIRDTMAVAPGDNEITTWSVHELFGRDLEGLYPQPPQGAT
jgi:hypothetical protein